MGKFLKSCAIFSVVAGLFVSGLGFQKNIVYASEDVEISSKSAILVEADSGEVLFKKNESQHLPVASMVKMMTILIALEELDDGLVTLDSLIQTSENAAGMGGSQVFLDPFQEYRFEDLLKSVIMASANDASVALAEHFNGSEKAFTNRMNKRAKELSMLDTHYANCTGLPAPESYSSAKDCSLLLSEILKHEVYHKYSTIWMDTLIHPSGRQTELVNTNKLVRFFEGCDGGKTGSTNEAGCCLSTTAVRNDMRLISVIIGAENSKTRFNESSNLLSFGFKNFESQKLVDSSCALKKVPVLKGKLQTVDVFAAEDFSAVVRKGGQSAYTTKIEIAEEIKAPTKNNTHVGKICVFKDGNLVKEIGVVTHENVEHLSILETAKNIIHKW